MGRTELFISGTSMLAASVVGLFFLKFWTKTRDRLFLLFSTAFGLLAIERVILVISNAKDETETWIYLLRLLAFLLIIYAVVDKNRAK